VLAVSVAYIVLVKRSNRKNGTNGNGGGNGGNEKGSDQEEESP
jgi:hypothetical protein